MLIPGRDLNGGVRVSAVNCNTVLWAGFRPGISIAIWYWTDSLISVAQIIPFMQRGFIILAIVFCGAIPVAAQHFSSQQQGQERLIKSAQKRGRITAKEYDKLMNEQATIRRTIAEAEADGTWTPREKNAVAGKLNRAEKRLRRYKNNREVY